jgi:hypothetical protein
MSVVALTLTFLLPEKKLTDTDMGASDLVETAPPAETKGQEWERGRV